MEGSFVRAAREIQSIIQQDPGDRGLARWAIGEQLLPAATSLSAAGHCLICTGFFIPTAGVIETDGPPGTIVLAQALLASNQPVTILTDRHAEEIIQAGLDIVDCSAELLAFSEGDRIDYADVVTLHTTHFVAVERPGPAADGFHYNFKGEIITEYLAPLDRLFAASVSGASVTIGIGDGGNELGMGNVAPTVDSLHSPGPPYACVVPSDFCICAGVSNWGAYGLAALLSVVCHRNLLLSPDSLSRILSEIVRAGAVDGITARQEVTVDNLPPWWEDHVYRALYRTVEKYCS